MSNGVNLLDKKCYNHSQREVVAKCVQCQKYFCRECISEYDDRICCATCINKIITDKNNKVQKSYSIFNGAKLALSIIACYLIFFFIAKMVSNIPNKFHDGIFINAEENGED